MKGILWLSAINQSLPTAAKFPNLARHFHVTLQFGVDWESLSQDVKGLVGKEFEVKVLLNCYNEKIQALYVDLPEEVSALCRNSHPHITISMADGVKPVESNQMLSGAYLSEWGPSSIPNSIVTTLQFHQFT
jgi:tRNA splicing ligase